MNRILLVGIGNTLRGDDGAGARAASRLAELLPSVDCVLVHQVNPEMAELVTKYDRVYFLDASIEADRVRCLPVNQVTGTPGGTHALSLEGLMRYCRYVCDTGAPPIARLVEIPAAQFEIGETLSERTTTMVGEAVDLVKRDVEGAANHG